jgi:hypothetical protein
MAIYQCFFFCEGHIGAWENIECQTDSSFKMLLEQQLFDGNWNVVEAWMHDRLVCRLVRLASGGVETEEMIDREG